MAYTPTNWVNDSAPAINATNLNKIETGIDDAHDDLDAATEAATAGELIRRDGSGRAKVATPSATGDIATKGYVDGLASNYATAAQGSLADSAVQPSTVDAKGDLLVGTADNTVGRLAVGSDGQVLVADSGEATGLKFAAPSGGGGGFLGAVPYSGEYMFNAVRGGANVNGVTPVVGTLYCVPLYNTGAPYDVDRIAIQNGTGGGGGAVARLGAYTVGADGRIGDLIFDAGTVDMTGTGDKNITINETIPTGVTLLVMVLNDTTCRPRFVGSTRYASDLFWRGGNGPSPSHQNYAWISYTGYSTSGLPSTGTTAGESLNSGDCPMIAVRAA